MDIITNNAEQALLNIIKNHPTNDSLHRCLHLQLSKLDGYNFEYIKNILENQLIDNKARIFVTWDKDIFVYAHGISTKSYNVIKQQAQGLFQGHSKESDHVDHYINHYDLFKNRAFVKRLLEHKLNEHKLISKAKELEALSKVSKEKQEAALEEALDYDLIESLEERRKLRREPEILVVEDDDYTRTLISTSLKSEYITNVVTDGYNAIINYISKAPDIVFLDIGLPDMSGHDVLDRIINLDPDAYIIMISGHRDQRSVVNAIKAGAKGYITKPFTKEMLFRYIEKSPAIKGSSQSN